MLSEIENLLDKIINRGFNSKQEILEEMWHIFSNIHLIDFYKHYSLLYSDDFDKYIRHNLKKETIKAFEKLVNDYIKIFGGIKIV